MTSSGRGWQALVQEVPGLAGAGRYLSADGWRREHPLGDPAHAQRCQEGGVLDTTSNSQVGCSLSQGAGRGWKVPAGHRSVLPAGAAGRGHQIRRDAAESWQRGTYRRLTSAVVMSDGVG